MNKISVEGHPNLYRDISSGAIINNNESEYENYIKSYQNRQQQSERIDILESEISQIKQLLQKMMEKL